MVTTLLTMDKGSFLYAVDGRLMVRPTGGKVHEASDEERKAAAHAIALFYRQMQRTWRRLGDGLS